MITSVDVLYPICSIQLTRPNAIAMAIIIIQPTPDHKRKSKKTAILATGHINPRSPTFMHGYEQ